MTDARDRKDRQETDSDRSEAEPSEFVSGSKADATASGDEAESASDGEGPLTVEETIQLSATQSEESVSDSKSPSPAIQATPPKSTGNPVLSVSSEPETVVEPVSPASSISAQVSEFAPHSLEVRRIAERASGDIQPETGRKVHRGHTHLDAESLTVIRKPDVISRGTRPSTTLSQARVQGGQALLDEVEEIDPVFEWSGGLPYGTNRPTLILHCAEEGIPSFRFMQRCLRDTYAELEGGEPTVEPVEFVANEPQVPVVGGRIVTLDLTDRKSVV